MTHVAHEECNQGDTCAAHTHCDRLPPFLVRRSAVARTSCSEPETRPEFRCYVSGQAKAWQAEYDAKIAADAKRDAQMQALLELKQRMIDKNLL